MRFIPYILRFWACLMIAGGAFGQDLHFTQLYESPFLRNPSLAGIYSGQYRLTSVFRNQWQSVTVPYQTMGAAIEYKIKGPCMDDVENINIGLQVMRDQAGDSKLTRTLLQAAISYRRQLDNGLFISGGFLAGPVSNNFNPQGLRWDDQFVGGVFDPGRPTAQPILNSGRSYFDLGAGLSVNGGSQYGAMQWYAGGALHHINKPAIGFGQTNASDTRLPIKAVISGGMATVVNEMDDRLIFHGDLTWQNPNYEVLLGAFFKKWLLNETGEADKGISMTIGAVYRWADAICPVVKLNVNQWSVGLSYDANISKLSASSQLMGGFELTLVYRIAGSSRDCSRFGCIFD